MRIGILGTSDIAFRRFLPALINNEGLKFVGVASRDLAKTKRFTDSFGGIGYDGYDALLNDATIDCVYIPLPPALHFEWGHKTLDAGKHIFMEKPFTTSIADTEALIKAAEQKALVIHENYMFRYHEQIKRIKEVIASGEIGDVRLIRIDFGFPFRGMDDFRYDKSLGGGALLDCGGYALLLARMFLDNGGMLIDGHLGYKNGVDVDIYGSAVLRDAIGTTAQVAFGIDNDYRCDLNIWGSAGTIIATRILTAPTGMEPPAVIRKNGNEKKLLLPSDNAFLKSMHHFLTCVRNSKERKRNYVEIAAQSKLHLSIK
jgi:predicted dehydrogenase